MPKNEGTVNCLYVEKSGLDKIIFAACFEEGIIYAAGNFIRKVEVSSTYECQEECKKESNCDYFTFLQSSLSCDLKTNGALVIRQELGDAISGPKTCQEIIRKFFQCKVQSGK